jgi:translation initiation factor 4E
MAAAASSTPEMATTPLHRRWVLWYDNPRLAPEGSNWKDNLKKCGVFGTAEEFWQIFNNIKPAGQLAVNSNYHLFREGIEPMWEDPENIKGGKFVLNIPRKDAKSGRSDEWWLFTVLAVLGETMDLNGNQVCGAVVSIRKSQNRIALWLKSADRETCIKIAERWKRALEVSSKTTFKYQAHKDGAITQPINRAHVKKCIFCIFTVKSHIPLFLCFQCLYDFCNSGGKRELISK